MGWFDHPIPNWVQWIGFFTTLIGTVLALWAALSATSAKRQATAAKLAAIRAGRVLELGDLIAEMQELQTLLARRDYESIAAKAAHLKGRVVRLKLQSYNLLSDEHAAELDTARAQLESIIDAAVPSRAADATRVAKIQTAFGHASEALNRVLGVQHLELHGVRADGDRH